MTEQPSPTSTATPPAPPAEQVAWSVRRTLRTPQAETWDLVSGSGERGGTFTAHFGPDAVEGVLAVPEGVTGDAVRGLLAWLTDLLALDHAAGPAGTIHWVVASGSIEDFWRRSPGRRATGAELDVAETRARVEPVLHAMFPSVSDLPDGGYAVDAGSVRVFLTVQLVDASVVVRVFSITNVDVPLDTELPAYLLALNFTMPIGRFSLDAAKRAVWFDHVLTADQLDDTTLSRVVATVAGVADRYDDDIKARFGGRTFREEGSPVAAAATAGMAGGYL